jgi:cytochrome c oxidase subunit 3
MTDITHARPLKVGSIERRALGWTGMMALIATEASLFVYLEFSYYYFVVQFGRPWLPDKLPEFTLSVPETIILLLSSVTCWWGERALRRGRKGTALLGLILGIVLGVIFVTLQLIEWFKKPFAIYSNSYASLYFTITGFHMTHVVGGLVVLVFITLWTALGYFDHQRHSAVSIGIIYWHFVDAVWLTVFFTLYITPRLG